MTAARHRRKSTIACVFAAAVGFLPLALLGRLAVEAATTERVVTDRHSGLAVYGFDPVAYFTDQRPLAGRPEFEYAFAGATWRFRNEGNRAAFVDRPDIYMPRYGGYDAVALARGVAIAGHPMFWLVSHDRLYLFQTPATRAVFAADPPPAVADAEAKWPAVGEALVP